MAKCLDVANFFITVTNDNDGDIVTNLKLQKLMYYAQGYHLAMYDKPLFDEPIEAWMYGPVVPSIYRHFRESGNNPLPLPENFRLDVFGTTELSLLCDVQNTYGQYSAWKLAEMTHNESPWKNIDADSRPKVISHDALRAYFATQIEE